MGVVISKCCEDEDDWAAGPSLPPRSNPMLDRVLANLGKLPEGGPTASDARRVRQVLDGAFDTMAARLSTEIAEAHLEMLALFDAHGALEECNDPDEKIRLALVAHVARLQWTVHVRVADRREVLAADLNNGLTGGIPPCHGPVD
jgi:hypothetical protein